MKYIKRFILLSFSFLTLNQSVNADVVFEMGLENGSEEIITTTLGRAINSGGGIKLSIGLKENFNKGKYGSVSFMTGLLFDNLRGENGKAKIFAPVLDAIYRINSGKHVFGIGATMHVKPVYKDNIDEFEPLEIIFETATGTVLEYGYFITRKLLLSLKSTSLTYTPYEVTYGDTKYYPIGLESNADSIGLYLSGKF